jgi:hypothetical protein
MASRIRANEMPRGRRTAVQAKKATSNQTGAPRSALGEIGNKTSAGVGPISDKDVKKLVSGLKKNVAVKEIPALHIEDTDQNQDISEDVELVQDAPPAFPEGVVDIDGVEEDLMNPQLCVEYAPAIYTYLRGVEEGLSIRKDFLQGYFVNGKMRGVLVDWLIEVHSQFKLLQETLYMTVYVIDKFLQTEGYSIRRNKLQLVGVTAMFIASKVEEMYAPEINDFVYITDNAYSAGEIRQMELRILNTLGFNFSRPLPLHFLRRNSKAGDVDVQQHTLAKYLIEISLLEYELVHIPPSLLASAALFLSLRVLDPSLTMATTWSPNLQHYSTYQASELIPIVCKLAGVVARRKESKLQAVHTKYNNKRFMRVSQLADLNGEVVQKLSMKQLATL